MSNGNVQTVYLPLSSAVYLYVYTNAAFTQQVTITPSDASPIVYQGSGEGMTLIGQRVIQTPASSSNPRGYPVTVSVQTQQGGQWVPSSTMQGSSGIMYYQTVMVVSEDYVDQDWNDSVTQFCWWVPPTARPQGRG